MPTSSFIREASVKLGMRVKHGSENNVKIPSENPQIKLASK